MCQLVNMYIVHAVYRQEKNTSKRRKDMIAVNVRLIFIKVFKECGDDFFGLSEFVGRSNESKGSCESSMYVYAWFSNYSKCTRCLRIFGWCHSNHYSWLSLPRQIEWPSRMTIALKRIISSIFQINILSERRNIDWPIDCLRSHEILCTLYYYSFQCVCTISFTIYTQHRSHRPTHTQLLTVNLSIDKKCCDYYKWIYSRYLFTFCSFEQNESTNNHW